MGLFREVASIGKQDTDCSKSLSLLNGQLDEQGETIFDLSSLLGLLIVVYFSNSFYSTKAYFIFFIYRSSFFCILLFGGCIYFRFMSALSILSLSLYSRYGFVDLFTSVTSRSVVVGVEFSKVGYGMSHYLQIISISD